MIKDDIRWQQRFHNFDIALRLLEQAVNLSQEKSLSELEEQGVIQRFEFTHELAWNVLKDYFEYQGNSTITGSRDAIREGFNKGLLENGDQWMQMIKSRNLSSLTYDESVAIKMVDEIINCYYPLFVQFKNKMNSLIQ